MQSPHSESKKVKSESSHLEINEEGQVVSKRSFDEESPSVKRLIRRIEMMEKDPEFKEIMEVAFGGRPLQKSLSAPNLSNLSEANEHKKLSEILRAESLARF